MLVNKSKSHCPNCGQPTVMQFEAKKTEEGTYEVSMFCGKCRYHQEEEFTLNPHLPAIHAPEAFLHMLEQFEKDGRKTVEYQAEIRKHWVTKH